MLIRLTMHFAWVKFEIDFYSELVNFAVLIMIYFGHFDCWY